jgi:hypothetical protein
VSYKKIYTLINKIRTTTILLLLLLIIIIIIIIILFYNKKYYIGTLVRTEAREKKRGKKCIVICYNFTKGVTKSDVTSLTI